MQSDEKWVDLATHAGNGVELEVVTLGRRERMGMQQLVSKLIAEEEIILNRGIFPHPLLDLTELCCTAVKDHLALNL